MRKMPEYADEIITISATRTIEMMPPPLSIAPTSASDAV